MQINTYSSGKTKIIEYIIHGIKTCATDDFAAMSFFF